MECLGEAQGKEHRTFDDDLKARLVKESLEEMRSLDVWTASSSSTSFVPFSLGSGRFDIQMKPKHQPPRVVMSK